jgi:hypothetical protein
MVSIRQTNKKKCDRSIGRRTTITIGNWSFCVIISLPQLRPNVFNDIVILFQCSPLVCKNICKRIRCKRLSFGGGGNYFDGKKYCRRCEVYLNHKGLFCPCCGMQLRLTPSSRECKEFLRKRKSIV